MSKILRLAYHVCFSPLATIFYALLAGNLAQILAETSGLISLPEIVAGVLFVQALAFWALKDASRKGRTLPYSFGSFVCMAWPIVMLWYIFSSRGWRGFLILGIFLMTWLLASFLATLPWLA